MLGLHPFEPFGYERHHMQPQRHHRPQVPVRRPPSPTIEPLITLSDQSGDKYVISVSAPEDWTLDRERAVLSDSGRSITVEGSLTKKRFHQYQEDFHQYQTIRRAGVYSAPTKRALAGVLPPGELVNGGAPTNLGWIALDDDESWMFDDGSLALVGRPLPASRPIPFSKRITLPADADPRHATSTPLRNGSGGLTISVPRTIRKQAPAPRSQQIPINVKRPAPTSASAGPSPVEGPKGAARSAPSKMPAPADRATPPSASPPNDVSADDFKQRHKRKAAERRGMHDGLRSALYGDDYEGPVLTECDASEVSSRNVQSPSETEEAWVALTDGRFVKVDGNQLIDAIMMDSGRQRRAAAGPFKRVDSAASDDDAEELSYWGF